MLRRPGIIERQSLPVEVLRRMRGRVSGVMWQGDREILPEDIAYLRSLARRFPGLSRKELTCTLCEHLDWLTPAGQPKLTACSKLLERLEEAGEVRLPSIQKRYRHRGSQACSPIRLSARSAPQAQLKRSLAELGPVRLRVVTTAQDEALWNEYVERYHPLGYKKPFGYWVRYFIEAGPHRLGCVLLGGAAKALTPRERWIGWNERQRLQNLPWVVNNSRFLLFPWVEVANLASHVLGQLARRVADDWQARWGYRPLLLETFVDPARFHGTCYRAAAWELLGRTTGEGLVRPGRHYQTSPKLIFAKPLQADFRHLLCGEQLQGRRES